jgi:hypothetical protein
VGIDVTPIVAGADVADSLVVEGTGAVGLQACDGKTRAAKTSIEFMVLIRLFSAISSLQDDKMNPAEDTNLVPNAPSRYNRYRTVIMYFYYRLFRFGGERFSL